MKRALSIAVYRAGAASLAMRFAPAFVAGLALALAACKPDLNDRESRIEEARIVAIVAEPPEAKPGVPVTYKAVVASHDGPLDGADVRWDVCATPKLLTENGAVSPECLRDGVRPLAEPPPVGTTATGAILSDACALFGPDAPPGSFRPRDPDSTGGYYQPVRATWRSATAFARARVSCNLANAPADVTLEFNRRYVANENPRLGTLTARVDGELRPLDRLPAGRGIELAVGWEPRDAESYVALDPTTKSVVVRREAMRVSWYATAGSFETDRTGRAEGELDTFTNNVWFSGTEPGLARLWVVLRDSRGGSTYAVYTLSTVSP
ncbi:hypothetical protein [Pendulispora albinea]|uniref:Uncharacterized protein n=1 Tax=Pendulispora albinea TaxID=2741071 RepID=A0ABZ2LQ70_9BACT